MVFMKSGSLFVGSSMSCESWVYGYDPETKSFRHFSYNENPRKALNTIIIIIIIIIIMFKLIENKLIICAMGNLHYNIIKYAAY